jgi:hypothetical protein
MATYLSNLYASGLPTFASGGMGGIARAVFAATIPAGTVLATNDIIKLAPIPLQYKVTNWYLDLPGLDQSAGLVTRLGDYTHSNGIYATGLTLGRTVTEGYVSLGGTGTTGGTVGSQNAVYTVRHSSRTNRDAADDFMLALSTGPSLAATSTARVVYGYVDFEADTMADTQ